MGADVMGSEGAAHTSIRTGLARKRAALRTAGTSRQAATTNVNQQWRTVGV